jgi:hypothetical protein
VPAAARRGQKPAARDVSIDGGRPAAAVDLSVARDRWRGGTQAG